MVRKLRWGLIVGAAWVVACSHDRGAVLELHSLPDGTRSIVVILAGVAADSNDLYDGDRLTVSGQAGASGDVDYFKQVDSFEFDGADTSLGIYNAAGITDAQYIPFVLAFDTAGGSGNRLAAGTFAHAASITIRDSEQDLYDVNMEAVTVVPVPVGAGLAEGNFIPVACLGTQLDSGFAWHTMSAGSQVRVLTPLDPDPIGKTAHGRAFDLDCDGDLVADGSGRDGSGSGSDNSAPRTDCDDLEPTVYTGAFNTTCSAPNNCTTGGLGTCPGATAPTPMCPGDGSGPPPNIGDCDGATPATTECLINPVCKCGARCAECMVDIGPGKIACVPASAMITVPSCIDCQFAIAAVSPPSWSATLTAATATGFTVSVSSPAVPVDSGSTSIAQVYVQVTGQTLSAPSFSAVVALNLGPSGNTNATCSPSPVLTCQPITSLDVPTP